MEVLSIGDKIKWMVDNPYPMFKGITFEAEIAMIDTDKKTIWSLCYLRAGFNSVFTGQKSYHMKYRYRSAITGRYVTADFAKKNPDTTVRHKVKEKTDEK